MPSRELISGFEFKRGEYLVKPSAFVDLKKLVVAGNLKEVNRRMRIIVQEAGPSLKIGEPLKAETNVAFPIRWLLRSNSKWRQLEASVIGNR